MAPPLELDGDAVIDEAIEEAPVIWFSSSSSYDSAIVVTGMVEDPNPVL